MIFNTWVYALFLIVTVLAYWLLPVRARPWALIGFGFRARDSGVGKRAATK